MYHFSRFFVNLILSGLILMCFDFSGIIAASVLGNFSTTRKMRWLCLGLMLTVTGCVLPASSQLFIKVFSGSTTELTSFCNHTSTISGPVMDRWKSQDIAKGHEYTLGANKFSLYWFHILGALSQGLGTTLSDIVGEMYLNDILPQPHLDLTRVSIFHIMSFAGVPLSYILGGYLLKIHVIFKTNHTDHPGEPGWIGAWWAGYAIPAIVLICSTFLLLLFPRKMKANVVQNKAVTETSVATPRTKRRARGCCEIILDLWYRLKGLFGDKISCLITLAETFLFLQKGGASFYPKIYALMFGWVKTQQFKSLHYILKLVCFKLISHLTLYPRLTAEHVGLLLGGLTILSFIIGTGAGLWYFKERDIDGM